MAKQYEVVAICKSHAGAESAVKELRHRGFDMKKLSIVGRDDHTDENAVGCFDEGNRVNYWSKTGAFCGGIWGMLKHSIVQSGTALKTDRRAVIARGSAEEGGRAREIISRTTPESVEKHSEPHAARA